VADLRGGYPELVSNPAGHFVVAVCADLPGRDVRSLRQVGDITSFQNFLRALAARTGQLLSLSDLARDLGIAVNTAKA
jgi:predicted AAA+ superfamily ATPase